MKSQAGFAFATVCSVLISVCINPNSASALGIVNGSFEPDFTGWTTTGNTSIRNSSFGITPTNGSNEALLRNDQPEAVVTASVLSFLGLSLSLDLDTLLGGTFTRGAAIKQTFTANAGDTLSFDWNFLTNEPANSLPLLGSNDAAFVSLVQGGTTIFTTKLANTSNSLSSASTVSPSYANQTGFQSFLGFTLPTTGSYTLGFAVLDEFGVPSVDSGLVVDNVVAVPFEFSPGLGVAFLGAGFGLTELRKYWRKRKTT